MTSRGAAQWGLVAGLTVLPLVMASRVFLGGSDPPPPWPVAGEAIEPVVVQDAAGDRELRFDGEWTAVLSFHSECTWCAKAAPAWKEWFETTDLRVVVVSREPLESARAYADLWTWEVDVVSLPIKAHPFTGRTPWAFLIDPDGRLAWQGVAQDLTELDAAAQSLRGRAAPSLPTEGVTP